MYVRRRAPASIASCSCSAWRRIGHVDVREMRPRRAQDRYALAGGCYGLKSLATGSFAAKTADGGYGRRPQAGPSASTCRRPTSAATCSRQGRDFLANGTPAAGRRRPPPAAPGRRDAGRADPGRGRAERLRRLARRGGRRRLPADAARPAACSPPATAGALVLADRRRGRPRALRLRAARRLRGLPGGRDERHRRADARRHVRSAR